MAPIKNLVLKDTEAFLFGGISPPNKKIYSQRPRRLGGENFILVKHDISCTLYPHGLYSYQSRKFFRNTSDRRQSRKMPGFVLQGMGGP